MKLSTSTNLLYLRPDYTIYQPEKAVEKIVGAGFHFLDFNFYDWVITKGSPYMEKRGDEWLQGMAEQAKRLGVSYEQAHAHFYNFTDECLSCEKRDFQQKQVIRSMRNAAVLGAKVVVTHPGTKYSPIGNYRRLSLEANKEYFRRLLDELADTDIRIAIENMTDIDTVPVKKYGALPEELAELIEEIGDSRVGVCWDFEHGDLMRQNQPEIVRFFGNRLIATHVSDQHGYNPTYLTHRLPMTGTIDWKPIILALKEIHYQGCFSFEAHNYLNVLPDCAIDSALKLAYDIGEYLMSLEEAK